MAVTTKARGASLDSALQRAGFRAEKLPPADHATADEWLARAQRDQKQISAELDQIREELRSIAARSAAPLAELEAWIENERRLLEAERTSPRTDTAVLITGWVPEAAARDVRRRLHRLHGRPVRCGDTDLLTTCPRKRFRCCCTSATAAPL